MKTVILTEKPSVAKEYISVLGINGNNHNGYVEDNKYIVTWCYGHLIEMSYPEKYDAALKKWTLEPLPFIPTEYKYEVKDSVKDQFKVVKTQFERSDVDTILFCGDSAREGEYIGRLVLAQCNQSKVSKKKMYRVWIDSQTEDEIKRGLREKKPLSEYDNLAKSAYCRAKEDYLMGINYSRAEALMFQQIIKTCLGIGMKDKLTMSIGRVITCVLGMVVNREETIKHFEPTSFYKVHAKVNGLELEWQADKDSEFFESELLYNEKGFLEKDDAEAFADYLSLDGIIKEKTESIEKKKAPLLYNLAEAQNDGSKIFKISPNDTLDVIQALYEKKLVTYPRTDARVISSAVAKVIDTNISGIAENYEPLSNISNWILKNRAYEGIEKTKYVDDSKISDHYAIIPTGSGYQNLDSLSNLEKAMYDLICRRFLAIFLPAAEYKKCQLIATFDNENFYINTKTLTKKGFLGLYENSNNDDDEKAEERQDNSMIEAFLSSINKGDSITVDTFELAEGTTKPPSRYNSGSLILAMENAGKLIEDEELREQIKSSGIGTSATRGEVIDKLERNNYINVNEKTQIVTPSKLGYAIYAVVKCTIPDLLKPNMTASWEKGLSLVAEGKCSEKEFMDKLNAVVTRNTNLIKTSDKMNEIVALIQQLCS